MYKFIIVLCLLSIIKTGCNTRHSDTTEIISVNVCYIKGPLEPHTQLMCGQIETLGSLFTKDTILVDSVLLKKIEDFIQILDVKNSNNNSTYNDIRISCILNFRHGKTRKLCIGKFNDIELDGKNIKGCDSLGYIIKKHCGYYNYFEKRFLDQFKEIQQFGVPLDYDLIIEHHLLPPSVKEPNK